MAFLSVTATKYLNNINIGTKKIGLGDIINDLYDRHFNPPAGRTITANDTLTATDAASIITVNSGSAVAITIPDDTTAGWSGNVTVSAYQAGAGAVSFAAGAGVTLRTPSGAPTAAQYSMMRVTRVGANEWAYRR